MDVQITGQGIDLGRALQDHVTETLSAGVEKYFDRSAEGQVTFQKEGSGNAVEITLHLASGVFLASHGKGQDAYGAFDTALQKLEKRLRRYKRRLKDHHTSNRSPLPAEEASSYILQGSIEAVDESDEAEAPEGEDGPLVIAERATILREMTVSDAVLQLEVADDPVVIFRNAKHGDLNVVYRRDDGNVGWIDGGRRG
ncbi:Ribosomal subunit interface protein Y [Parvularcula bermudensis HTCC2503]|uniref:Ribosome hibernation promoting factor n=1 Tax=Parvularcula bermudensis (strain ATCC BAA-594 / HTCC2503 / KCTC 12087) TaxID=314260 RepID=E0THP3_PARBH|nr:ribosome-associated translation inhibitor RaiA [Parvularcula bermudensis]ADM09339.1 Ribosomal subunit interface protein Y [Parvularcula bermudensis HTCC2503]